MSSPPKNSKAAEFWAKNLDPQNLGGGAKRPADPRGPSYLALEDEIAFAQTPDFLRAAEWLRVHKSEALVVDLGAGLGANSFAFARLGFRVIAIDTSLDRLRHLKRRAEEAGCADRIMTLAAAAESLPLRGGSLEAVFTKSVLIHTDLKAAANEIARILSIDGRAALLEPMPHNPFAWLYRQTLAPKEWKTITRYFGRNEQRIFIRAIGPGKVEPFYLFGFGAFAFQFAWPRVRLFFGTLRLISVLDRGLFRLMPWTRRFAWFGLILCEKDD